MPICRKNNLAFTERINRCIRSCFHKQNGRTFQGTISPFNPHLHFRTSHYKNTFFIPPIVNGGSQNQQKKSALALLGNAFRLQAEWNE